MLLNTFPGFAWDERETMKQTPRVHECAAVRELARALIAQALRDLQSHDPVKKLDALMWLTGDDFPIWADAMAAPFMDPYKMLSMGSAKRLTERRMTA
jgi:hypothetical protein